VGIRLIVEVLDHCPTTLTHREKLALVVLAESARDRTRECLPGIENDEKVARRMKLPGRSTRYAVIQALRTKGALEVVSAGRKYSRAVYRISDLTAAQGPAFPDADETPQGPETPDAEHASQGPENQDAEPEAAQFSGSRNSGLRVPKTWTQGPENQDPFPSTPSTPSLIHISAAPPTPAAPAADAAPAVGFADFYAAYPKKRERAAAAKAWDKAIKTGASAARIVAAARTYANERDGQDPKYTKHPATWLNKGCYDDEPDPVAFPPLKAVSGGYEPYRNPVDQSAYDDWK
jgi:hypothetical protein